MSLLRTGAVPVPRRMALPAVAVLAAALLTGGCSSRPNGTTSYIWQSEQPAHVAAAPPRPVEMEDDGREAQVPPPASIRNAPDDPTEPYSRNYGSAPARAPARPVPGGPVASAAPQPDGQPPAYRRQIVSAAGQD